MDNKTALTRGVEKIFPDNAGLEKMLNSGKKLRIYNGIDPTGPTLHVGHMATLMKLRDFQLLGHQIILLIGGFTATIGDPDKMSIRVPLTRGEVEENAKLYKEQAGRILDMENVEFRNNAEWFEGMTFEEILKLASEFTVSRLLEREMFQKRMEKGEPVYLHELMYPMMQGYDSLALGVDIEVGGNDQTTNMLVGRDFMMRHGKEKCVVAGKLLTDPTGKKMGKTEGNMIALNDTPENMYGKVMSWPDSMLPLSFEVCTRLPMDEAEKAIKDSPRDAKMWLAREIVEQFGGKGNGALAETAWTSTFQSGRIPESAPIAKVSGDEKLVEVLRANNMIASNSDWRRLVDENAVKILDENGEELEKVSDYDKTASAGNVIKIGKMRFLRLEEK